MLMMMIGTVLMTVCITRHQSEQPSALLFSSTIVDNLRKFLDSTHWGPPVGSLSSSVEYPAMGVALYRWGAMAQSNSSSDSSLGEESLSRTSAGAEFQSLTVRGKKENL